MSDKSPQAKPPFNAKLIERFRYRQQILAEFLAGLEGKPFSWSDVRGKSGEKILKEMGIELVTATGAKRRGHVVKPRACPVGSRYFCAPISNSADLYVLGVHTAPKK